MTATINLQEQTKKEFNNFGEHKNETYDEIIRKMLYITRNVKENPQIGKKLYRKLKRLGKELNKEISTLKRK